MSTPDQIVTIATQEQLKHTLPLVLEVFMEDPSWVDYYPDRMTRERKLTTYYGRALIRSYRHGAVDTLVLEQRIVAAALWDAPHTRWWQNTISRVTGKRSGKLSWHLEGIVVYSGGRGRGYGTTLLKHGLARADRANTGVTLEATSPASMRLYERNGFRAVDGAEFSRQQHEVEMYRSART